METTLAAPVHKSLRSAAHEQMAQMYARGDTQVSIAAALGYSHTGVGEALARNDVQARIKHIITSQHRPAQITAERVMRELGRIAFADIRDLYDVDGNLLPVHQLSDDAAATVSAIDVEVTMRGRGEAAEPVVTKKIRRPDKMGALGILAKHFKIVNDEGDGVSALASSLADRLKLARRRDVSHAEDAVEVQPAALPHSQETDDASTLW